MIIDGSLKGYGMTSFCEFIFEGTFKDMRRWAQYECESIEVNGFEVVHK